MKFNRDAVAAFLAAAAAPTISFAIDQHAISKATGVYLGLIVLTAIVCFHIPNATAAAALEDVSAVKQALAAPIPVSVVSAPTVTAAPAPVVDPAPAPAPAPVPDPAPPVVPVADAAAGDQSVPGV